ncbi:MAG: hypothetical protein KA746_00275 [Pyrinomonadaceae bacterium]|nr:hypothetical protein [Pyrinomonadaceae bacterium]MBP6214493.1 hypothetical protein [Pyrinomonadaceae bacterium]
MQTTLSIDTVQSLTEKLRASLEQFSASYPGGARQPVHVVYGGANLFSSETPAKLGRLAVSAFDQYAPNDASFASIFGLTPEIASAVRTRVAAKLQNEPIEDLRIDFEDGYGVRSDDEEDGHAASTARETTLAMANDALPPFFGIRIKALSPEAHMRAIRTLDIYLTTLVAAAGGRLPDNFVVTLPKTVVPEQAAALADVFDELESRLGIAAGTLKLELMIETTHSIVASDGRFTMPLMLAAARGRCRGAHFGAYDYTASCGITSANQDMLHQACDLARNMMQAAFAGTGVWLSDGATNVMPVGPHRGAGLTDEQIAENGEVVRRAWRLHFDHTRNSLANGFYQGWDLHPAQLVSRYAAVYSFFLESLDDASARLSNFIDKAARSTMVGDVFDDAATGQGLLLFFVRAANCGALTESEATARTGLTLAELRSASFADIIASRRK